MTRKVRYGTPWLRQLPLAVLAATAASMISLATASGIGAQVPMEGDPLAQISLDSLLSVSVNAAARHGQTIGQAPASVTIITREDISRYGYRTVVEALERVRGFHISDDRAYAYVGVRGLGRPGDYNSRVLVQLDGQTLNEAVYGGTYLGQELGVNLSEVERIEVVRGPGSALFGTGAMLAVIDIITMGGTFDPKATAAVEVGSNGHRHVDLAVGRRAAGMDIRVSGRAGESDGEDVFFPTFADPATNLGIAEGLDWERYASVRVTAQGQHLSVAARTSAREKAFPTGAFGVDFNHPDARTDDAFAALEVQYDRSVRPGVALSGRGFFDGYRYRGTYPAGGEHSDATDGHTFGTEAQITWDPRADNRVTAGVGLQRSTRADYRASWEGESIYHGDFPWDLLSAFVQNEAHLAPWISVTAGIRLDRYSFDRALTTPRAATVVRPAEGTVVKAIYGEAFRAPNVYERHYEDPGENKVNPDLTREHIRSYELVGEQRIGPSLYGTVSLYHNRVRDLIDVLLDPSDDHYWFVNTEGARARGVELELDARLSSGVSGFVSHAIQDARGDHGGRLSNSPRHLMASGLSLPVHPMVRVSSEVRWESRRRTVQDTWTAGGTRARLVASVEPFAGARLTAIAENVFNGAFTTPGSWEHEMAEIPRPGRALRIRAEYTF